MAFILLVLFAAFLIEGIGTYVSVVGLSALFAQNPVIIILAVALDLGKVVGVSFLYKYWKKINFFMKSYMLIAAFVLMVITSTGCFGYLSGEFQKAIATTSQDTVLLQSLEEEKTRLQARKEEIDKQITQLPPNYVTARRQLMQEFEPETKRINNRLAEIDRELPALKVEAIHKNVEVGPILYVAEAFDTTPEKAVKYVILIIIFVFDPLAIALLVAGNFLIENRKQMRATQTQPVLQPVVEAIPEPIVPEPTVIEPTHVDIRPVEVPQNEDPEPELAVPDQKPVIEESETPPESEAQREVIQLKHLKPKQTAKLEGVDGSRADVKFEHSQRPSGSSVNLYVKDRQ